MTAHRERTINPYRRSKIVHNAVRILLAVIVLVMQVPSIHSWDGHRYVVAGAITVLGVDLLWLAVRGRDAIILALGAYTLFVVAGGIFKEILDVGRPVLIPVTAGAVISAGFAIGLGARAGRRTKELERFIFSEASSLAFFATMIAAVTYALAQSWLELPSVSTWVVAGFGGVSWLVARVVLRHHYT